MKIPHTEEEIFAKEIQLQDRLVEKLSDILKPARLECNHRCPNSFVDAFFGVLCAVGFIFLLIVALIKFEAI